MALVGAVALLLTFNFVRELQADGYKALYDGAWIAHHGIPRHEALAVAAHGRPWVDEQWLAELGYYEAWRLGGYPLFAGLAAALVAASYMILAALMRRRGVAVMSAVCWTTLAILTVVGWTFVRAQNFALPLFAALLALCLTDAERERPRRRLVLVLPLLALWANLHGSVLLGAALATAYLAYRAVTMARRRLPRAAVACAALALAAALMPLATPYGLHILDYYSEFVGNRAMAAAATEWDAPAFPTLAFFQLYLPLAGVIVLALRTWARRDQVQWVLLGAVAVTAMVAGRESGAIVWFGMAAALLLAELTKGTGPVREPGRGFLTVMGVAAAALASVVLGSLAVRSNDGYESVTAVRAITATAAYATAHPCALILADNWDSSALLWHEPGLAGRVAFDARLEQFPPTALTRWVRFEVASSRRWPGTTGGYELLVGNADYTPALVDRLAHLRGGRVLASDSRGIAVLDTRAARGGSRCAPRGAGRNA